jgi:hypothetical protein
VPSRCSISLPTTPEATVPCGVDAAHLGVLPGSVDRTIMILDVGHGDLFIEASEASEERANLLLDLLGLNSVESLLVGDVECIDLIMGR